MPPRANNLYEILASYQRNRRQYFADRDALEQWQRRMLLRLYKETLPRSPYYRQYLGTPLENWPVLTAHDLARHFDQINTLGARHEDVFARAVRADISRDYAYFARDYIPLLSAGSKGRRRAFLISHEERIDRIGAILARLYPDELPETLSIAWYYRGNNAPCYQLDSEPLTLHSYDIQDDPGYLLKKLRHQQPHIIIAPASILLALLRRIMQGELELTRCTRVYNSGETLTARDRLALRRQFAVVGDLYQSVEGLLGITCAHGRLHLAEEKYHVEKEWLDDQHYIPLITAFGTQALPLVRYRVDDILADDPNPCPCGSCTQTVRAVEGRLDDIFILPTASLIHRSKTYPQTSHHALARLLPWKTDYRLTQTRKDSISLAADAPLATLQECRTHLELAWQRLGVDTAQLHWQLTPRLPPPDLSVEQRRIRRSLAATRST